MIFWNPNGKILNQTGVKIAELLRKIKGKVISDLPDAKIIKDTLKKDFGNA